MAESFFIDEDFDWWGDVEPGSASAPAVAVPRALPRRQPARTLAGDLDRLRSGFERRSPVSAAAAGLMALFLLAALAVVVRLSLTGEQPRELAAVIPASPQQQTTPAEPAPAEATAPEPVVLEEGKRGARVRDLQVALTTLGHLSGADGSFGAATTGAVAAFQGASGLAADGVAGPLTTTALQDALWERAGADAEAAGAGIAAAVEAGRLDQATAETARAAVAQTMEAIRAQSPGRGATLGLALREVAAAADGYSSARTPALFGQLTTSVEALAAGPPTIEATSVSDGAGFVYRFFPEHGYQFHPLASFAKLNGLARAERTVEAERLAHALAARGVEKGNTLVWLYRFPFGGPAEWTSGFAQAAGAQALARSGELLDDPALRDAAGAAFRAIPRGLTLQVGGGDWIQEYSFSDMAVLNAQLQSIISLSEYVKLSEDARAEAYVTGLSNTARSLIGDFDTGCWSLYSYAGSPASLHYHSYHVKLLESLARRTGDAAWRETARRWRGYLDAGGC